MCSMGRTPNSRLILYSILLVSPTENLRNFEIQTIAYHINVIFAKQKNYKQLLHCLVEYVNWNNIDFIQKLTLPKSGLTICCKASRLSHVTALCVFYSALSYTYTCTNTETLNNTYHAYTHKHFNTTFSILKSCRITDLEFYYYWTALALFYHRTTTYSLLLNYFWIGKIYVVLTLSCLINVYFSWW